MSTPDDPSLGERTRAIYQVITYRPALTAAVLVTGLATAVLEGIGLGFVLPIVGLARESGQRPSETGGLLGLFVRAYALVGLPFTLEYLLLGVAVVMAVRHGLSFLVGWLGSVLRVAYTGNLRRQLFRRAIHAQVGYFDELGSDQLLNAIVTQTDYAGRLIETCVNLLKRTLLVLVYLGIALYLAPVLTLLAGVALGVVAIGLRSWIEASYDVGSRVAAVNERVQSTAQIGVQGLREVKLFGMTDEVIDDFVESVSAYMDARIRVDRNEEVLDNSYQLMAALTVFGLIYFALRFTPLSLAELGVFLFAVFRLAPEVSRVNNSLYQVGGRLPHLIRTQRLVTELAAYEEPVPSGTPEPVPGEINRVAFEDVSFSYPGGERLLTDVSFAVERGEFVAFAGPSGAGKSTIVSLLSRLYLLDSGRITANGIAVDRFDPSEWRTKISLVSQNPHLFNDTLWYNLTLGNRNASRAEVDRVCEIAQVSEFLGDLPEGYETRLGDDGVRLSGGQRQRVAIARALLKNADLLVLDEATSDLDAELEERVHRAIEAMERDYAMIAVAHRLSTIVDADRIYTFDRGRIVESGTHGELLASGGTYANLYARQAQGS